MLWLSRHSGIGKKKAASRTALKVGLGNFSRDRCSEIDATAGIEEVEVVERRPYTLQLSGRRYGGIAGDEVNIGRQVLVDRVEVHVGRIDRLIEGKRPARDLGAGDLGRHSDTDNGVGAQIAVRWDASKVLAIVREVPAEAYRGEPVVYPLIAPQKDVSPSLFSPKNSNSL